MKATGNKSEQIYVITSAKQEPILNRGLSPA